MAEKRRRWAKLPDDRREAFLARHLVPVLLGPKSRYYAVDHHHLLRALHEEGCEAVQVTVLKDVSGLDKDAFWVFADNCDWCHPYDSDGQRVAFADIPKRIEDLADDPFRSLAGSLRQAGGYAKTASPFSEFLWADFLRRRLKRKAVEADFSAAVIEALTLAKLPAAKYLPGWCGAEVDG